jgi:tRNA-specific 2-thiouridylase
MARVVVGLSGGVDSSVTAWLMQQAGHEVIGIFMRNWNDQSVVINNECPWIDDSNDAMLVADQLGIPFQVLDLSSEYKDRIVDYMFAEYEVGRTPNPDVLCNREIKFDSFLKAAVQLGADYVATGHYVRKREEKTNGKTTYSLLAGLDRNKDQSYFLCQLNQEQLSKSLFPIGELQKSEVRKIAAEQGLITADKKDSQGLCFIGKVRLPDFLQQQLLPKEGRIIEVPANSSLYSLEEDQKIESQASPISYKATDGKEVGTHKGAHYFTIGQRKGLQVGGMAEPLFVIGTDVSENIIYVGQGESHPGLYRRALFIRKEESHWLRSDCELKEGEESPFLVRIRYRQPLQEALLISKPEGVFIRFKMEQKAITPGQFAVWYKNDELVGSGVIHK